MKRTCIALLLAVCAYAQKTDKPLKKGLYAIFKTEFGDITAILYEKDTPNSVGLFVNLAQGQQQYMDANGKLVKGHYYDNTTFFRIMPGTMVQGGSPTNESYNCGLKIKDETLPGITFHNGSLAVANTGTPDSGGCQFFFTTTVYPSWNNKYTIFGQVVVGLDVLDKLVKVPVKDEHPLTPPKLISVTFHREGPPPEVKPKK